MDSYCRLKGSDCDRKTTPDEMPDIAWCHMNNNHVLFGQHTLF